jgi:hypothetical protein
MSRRLLLACSLLLVLSASPLWAPHCTKGKPCGNSCIPQSSTCHIHSSPSYSAPVYSPPSRSAPSSGVSPLYSAPKDGCPISEDQLMLATQQLLAAVGEFRGSPSALSTSTAEAAIMSFEAKKRLIIDGKPSAVLLVALTNEAMLRAQRTAPVR